MDPNTTPALEPPMGITPDLVDPYTRQPNLIVTSVVCLTLTTVCIFIRTLTKAYLFKEMRLEDYFTIFAGFGFASFCGVMLAARKVVQGSHQWDVSVTGLMDVILLSNILEIIYGPAMFAAKASVILQLMQIFTANAKNFVYWSFITLLGLNGAFYFSIFVAFILACVPRAKITDPSLPGTCISINGSILATSVFNIVSDLSILILPLVVVWSLRIPLKRKLTVGAGFGTGVLFDNVFLFIERFR
ncbi:hypothetical protein OCU04_005930 [Sclerotinia nivalis]|uniref:Rhodopsin domain-containing protein n=1 Tax=Sclerotinia nivalis TaxID=352851 RepID=A0A9X0AM55_9HELO|nr:hypothetical protein OCU04_005930 [Sclerotinia nivalis]